MKEIERRRTSGLFRQNDLPEMALGYLKYLDDRVEKKVMPQDKLI